VQLTVPKGATAAQLTNLMEKPEGSGLRITDPDHITVPVHPYEIVSLEVSYAPEKAAQ
jgi:alpha-mannosidase